MKIVQNIAIDHAAETTLVAKKVTFYPATKATLVVVSNLITGALDGVVTVHGVIGGRLCDEQNILIDNAEKVWTVHIDAVYEQLQVGYSENGNTGGTLNINLLRGKQ